jgi:hypothetical protein
MNSRDPRTRYLLRKALSLASPLVEDEDCRAMEDLLHKLNGDSRSASDESYEWQTEARTLLREVLERPFAAPLHRPRPKVPIRLVTTDEAS